MTVAKLLPRAVLPPIWRELPAVARAAIHCAAPEAPSRGRAALLIPGFMSGDRAMRPPAEFLVAAGHAPHPAGISRFFIRGICRAADPLYGVVINGHLRQGSSAVSIATVVESAVRRHVHARVVSAAASLGVDRNRIAPETPLEDLGLDSLDVAELVQILEFEFDLKLFARAHGRVHTVGDAIDLVVFELS